MKAFEEYVRELREDKGLPLRKVVAVLEFMIAHKLWWDTVDFITNKLMGEYIKLILSKKINMYKNGLNQMIFGYKGPQ